MYQADSFVADEQPTTTKWNKLWSNDAAFNAGTGIADGALATAKFANDSVTATKIDWASTGADGGIWWEELGRTTLGVSSDTISISPISARRYLRIMFYANPTGGTINVNLSFNGDTGSNYNMRYSDNGGADATTGATTAIASDTGAVVGLPFFGVFDVINIASSEKLVIGHSLNQNNAGAGNAPTRREINAKWANTAASITRVDINNSAGTGDYAAGSELVVLGHN